MSVSLSGIFFVFFDGQTDRHFFVRLFVWNFFFFWRTDRRTKKFPSVCLEIIFFFDGQTDGRKNVRQSVRNFFCFFWRTDRQTFFRPSVCLEFIFFLTDRQTDEKMSVCLSGNYYFFWRTDRQTKKCSSVCPEILFFFDGQTDGHFFVRLSVRNFFFFFCRTDRRTKKCPSVCPEFFFFFCRTDRRTKKCPSVCPEFFIFFLTDRQTDIFSSVCLSGIFFFFDGQTDGRKNVRLSVWKLFFFLTDRQTDEKMSVSLSGIFFFFDGQTDGRKNVRLSVRKFFFCEAHMQMHCASWCLHPNPPITRRGVSLVLQACWCCALFYHWWCEYRVPGLQVPDYISPECVFLWPQNQNMSDDTLPSYRKVWKCSIIYNMWFLEVLCYRDAGTDGVTASHCCYTLVLHQTITVRFIQFLLTSCGTYIRKSYIEIISFSSMTNIFPT